MEKLRRVAAIHDISCFGKCSLTVALPIISAAGVECSVIPTAVLSTHTGGFTGFTYRDLTEDVEPVAEHWRSLNLRFDAIYTGFLGSFEQIDIVRRVFDMLSRENTLIAVDPVMADNGVLYKIFPDTFPAGMRSLCEKASLIMPNLTEATLMLGEKYREAPYTPEYIEGLLNRLAGIHGGDVVLTGVDYGDGKLGAAARTRDGSVSYAFAEKIEGYYHGTGDVFGSALVAALMRGSDLAAAIRVAVDFTVASIARTKIRLATEDDADIRFGVDFETGLAELPSLIARANG
jgi:pyridoxine kinase